MRPALLAAALVLVCGSAWAAPIDQLSVEATKAFLGQDTFLHVIAQVKNAGPTLVKQAQVACDIYDQKFGPLGTHSGFVNMLAPGRDSIVDVLIIPPPNLTPTDLRGECHVEAAV